MGTPNHRHKRSSFATLFAELRRRNVIRVATAYIVAAWLVIQVVETIFPAFGFGDAAVRLVVILLGVALIPTLIFSWAFEVTPDGLKREAELVRKDSATRFTGKKIDRAIMLLLALALSYFAVDKFVLDPERDRRQVEEAARVARAEAVVETYAEKSIAVLPFVNMSDDPSNEYFSDGISEEILNLLAKVPALRVTARSSSFSFKDKVFKIADVARDLNVGHVLEGSVRKTGDHVRITAQLIDARSDTHLWSETYDRKLDDIFAIQDEVARAISNTLRLELTGAELTDATPATHKAASLLAYDAFLRGRELLHRRKRTGSMDEALQHFRKALRLDGLFAPAHAYLGIASALSTPSVQEARWKALPHLERAQELDPDLPEVYGGYALIDSSEDPQSAVRHATKALQLNPNYADALNWLSLSLLKLGRFREAEDALMRMAAIDPMRPIAFHNHVGLLITSGRYDEARSQAEAYFGHVPRSHEQAMAFWQGKIAEGIFWYLKGLPGNFESDLLESVLSFTWIGEYAEARRIDAEMTYLPDVAAGRFMDAIEVAKKNLELYPEWERVTIADLGNTLYFAGNLEEALPLLQRFVELMPRGTWEYFEFHIAWSYSEMAMRLAHVSRSIGDEVGAQAAVQIVRQDLARLHALGLEFSWIYRARAMLAAHEHDTDRVVEALELVLRHGYRDPVFFRDPIFDTSRNDPRFIALRQKLDDLLALEREKTLQIICFDNPVPDEWQPLPETCQGVTRH